MNSLCSTSNRATGLPFCTPVVLSDSPALGYDPLLRASPRASACDSLVGPPTLVHQLQHRQMVGPRMPASYQAADSVHSMTLTPRDTQTAQYWVDAKGLEPRDVPAQPDELAPLPTPLAAPASSQTASATDHNQGGAAPATELPGRGGVQ